MNEAKSLEEVIKDMELLHDSNYGLNGWPIAELCLSIRSWIDENVKVCNGINKNEEIAECYKGKTFLGTDCPSCKGRGWKIKEGKS